MNTNKSWTQAICSTVIVIAYLLPWMDFSFIEGVFLLNDSNSSTGNALCISMGISPKAFWLPFLALIPFVSLFNAVLQWRKNSPRIAYYLNLIPFGICVYLIAFFYTEWNLTPADGMGVGMWLMLLVCFISFIVSWTHIAMNYYCYYKKYVMIVTILLLTAFVPFIGLVTGVVGVLHLPFLPYAWIVIFCTKNEQKEKMGTTQVGVLEEGDTEFLEF